MFCRPFYGDADRVHQLHAPEVLGEQVIELLRSPLSYMVFVIGSIVPYVSVVSVRGADEKYCAVLFHKVPVLILLGESS